MPVNEDYVADVLVEAGLVTRSQMEATRAQAGPQGAVDALIEQGHITLEDVTRTLAAQSGMAFLDLSVHAIPPDVIDLISPDDAWRYRAIPIALNDETVQIAVADPTDFDALDSLSYLLKREIDFVCTTSAALEEALRVYYGGAREQSDGDGVAIGDREGEGDAPIIKMVTMLLLEAHKARASDIHLEPRARDFRVRFRIDGVLYEMPSPPKKLQAAIISRLKIMTGSMSIAEKRLPQDGRIQFKIGANAVDLRVSSIPTIHGESIVMRILDKTSLMLGLPELGFLSDDQAVFENLITLPDGILLVTGPTGSGKTTTLYACLNYMNKPDRKLITVEDPVEYQIPGINQVQVNSEIGMTFPTALRAILRQAPNIIMIGEIRDAETASIAINASLTGHLVFSTLHTNDAPSAIARLVDIGVPSFLVSSSVRAVMAQRLVRTLCPHCKAPVALTEYELRALRIEPSQLSAARPMHATGCESCHGRGFKGRMGIFEIFRIDDEVCHMINNGANTTQLRKRARELGMRTLREDGIRKMLAGLTTVGEVITTTAADLD